MLSLTILGNNSAKPAYGRNPTSQYLQTEDTAYLIDCGEGTQHQMAKYKVRAGKISKIFISHLHGDHYFGLIGLMATMALSGRNTDLHIYAPADLEKILELQIKVSGNDLPYNYYFHPLGENGMIANDHRVYIYSFKVEHRIPTWGFRFDEIKNLRSVDAERAKAYDVPVSFYAELQKGKDYVNAKGTIIENEDLTIVGPTAKSYAYCADTIFTENFVESIRNVDVLYHETTYLKSDETKAASRFHSTTQQAAKIAKIANAKKLLIGHFSSRYEDLQIFHDETCCDFPETEIALEGTCFTI